MITPIDSARRHASCPAAQAVLARLRQEEGQWVPMPELIKVSISAIQSISHLRLGLRLMIENRTEVITIEKRRIVKSWYRLLPKTPEVTP